MPQTAKILTAKFCDRRTAKISRHTVYCCTFLHGQAIVKTNLVFCTSFGDETSVSREDRTRDSDRGTGTGTEGRGQGNGQRDRYEDRNRGTGIGTGTETGTGTTKVVGEYKD